MTFDNMDEVERYVMEQAKDSLEWMQLKVYDIIRKFLNKYYDEFSPEFYERTYQLFSSLVMTDIKKYGNGYIAEVYFDLSKLDYSMKKFEYWRDYTTGMYYNPFNRSHMSESYWFPNSNHSEQKTLSSAMVGSLPHGGKVGGTAIWIESIREIHSKFVPLFKEELIRYGIPVR